MVSVAALVFMGILLKYMVIYPRVGACFFQFSLAIFSFCGIILNQGFNPVRNPYQSLVSLETIHATVAFHIVTTAADDFIHKVKDCTYFPFRLD